MKIFTVCIAATLLATASAFAPESRSTTSTTSSQSNEEVAAPPLQDTYYKYEYNTAPFGGPRDEPPPPPLGPTLNGWTPDASQPCYGLPGAIEPLGYFDPLGFCKGRSLLGVKRFREAETVHGRVAMLASVGWLVGENLPTLVYGSSPPELAIHQIPDVPVLALLFPLFLFVNVTEALRAVRGWVEPDTGTLFTLRDSYYPGDLNWDPLGFKPTEAKDFEEMQNRELSHGRLAMLAVAGMCAQELANGKPVLEDFNFMFMSNPTTF